MRPGFLAKDPAYLPSFPDNLPAVLPSLESPLPRLPSNLPNKLLAPLQPLLANLPAFLAPFFTIASVASSPINSVISSKIPPSSSSLSPAPLALFAAETPNSPLLIFSSSSLILLRISFLKISTLIWIISSFLTITVGPNPPSMEFIATALVSLSSEPNLDTTLLTSFLASLRLNILFITDCFCVEACLLASSSRTLDSFSTNCCTSLILFCLSSSERSYPPIKETMAESLSLSKEASSPFSLLIFVRF